MEYQEIRWVTIDQMRDIDFVLRIESWLRSCSCRELESTNRHKLICADLWIEFFDRINKINRIGVGVVYIL